MKPLTRPGPPIGGRGPLYEGSVTAAAWDVVLEPPPLESPSMGWVDPTRLLELPFCIPLAAGGGPPPWLMTPWPGGPRPLAVRWMSGVLACKRKTTRDKNIFCKKVTSSITHLWSQALELLSSQGALSKYFLVNFVVI